jgi:hypothetical protein
MKSIRIAGACLVAMFALSMALGASASAAPVWEQCQTEKASTSPSRYTEGQCVTASATGGWAWQEVKGTEKVIGPGSLVLKDTKTPVGTVEVQCSGTTEGAVGPRRFARMTGVTEIKCSPGKECEKVETASPRNLPWQTELFETTEKTVGDRITSGGSGAPGWGLTCTVLDIKTEDVCTSESTSVLDRNMLTQELTGSRRLVGLAFENAGKANCTVGGEGSGEELGIVGLEKANGLGLRVS